MAPHHPSPDSELLSRVNGKEKWKLSECKGEILKIPGGFTSGLFLGHT